MSFPLRSPNATVGGIVVFGRILDKIRLFAKEGTRPAGYHLGPREGGRTFDDRVCRLLGVSFEALSQRTLEGGTDEEVLDWCFRHGIRPDDEQIEIWNTFMRKRGWRDSASTGQAKQKEEAGLSQRDDIVVIADIDADGQRYLVGPAAYRQSPAAQPTNEPVTVLAADAAATASSTPRQPLAH
jgi:gluconokinase